MAEGFGLPILEAMYFKLPIVASDIPVFHELTGGAYTSFDPRSESDMAQKLTAVFEKGGVTPAEDQTSRFSFDVMARETLHVYRKALNE